MKRFADQTLYEILEVPPDSPSEAITGAVERARALYGPGSLVTYTLMSTEEASLLFRRIEEAQVTLLDPAARATYDEKLSGHPGEGGAAASGTNAPPSPGGWPPVIPAVKAPPARSDAEGEDEHGDDDDERKAAKAAAATSVSLPVNPPPEPPTAPAEPAQAPRTPILLRREIPEAAPPAPAVQAAPPAPEPTPVPLVAPAAAPAAFVPDDTAWTGEVLRRLREARGISLKQISERTKVTRHHIENIEGDRYGALPAPVYLRGILLSIARELRLDGQKVARSYLERVVAGAPPPAGPARSR